MIEVMNWNGTSQHSAKKSVIDIHLIPLSPISRVMFAHSSESQYLQKLMRWWVKYGKGLSRQRPLGKWVQIPDRIN